MECGRMWRTSWWTFCGAMPSHQKPRSPAKDLREAGLATPPWVHQKSQAPQDNQALASTMYTSPLTVITGRSTLVGIKLEGINDDSGYGRPVRYTWIQG